ncbi:hypothetical protein TIFTF001_004124 [Ficus carica]|uniref:Uncharacterized protein n=1 Tax=Ficus carica TaxID=3494 RepID=A0AA88DC76_FICCA|nr:hypothetical protein TIFTF001_004124 [Ficus carica]
MLEEGLKKMPGCSMIEVRNKVTAFVAGNHSCPFTLELYKMLNVLEFEMRNPCFAGFYRTKYCSCTIGV